MSLMAIALLLTAIGGMALLLLLLAVRRLRWSVRLRQRARAIATASPARRPAAERSAGEGSGPLLSQRHGMVENWLRANWSGMAALEAQRVAAGIRFTSARLLSMAAALAGFLALALLLAGITWPVALLLAGGAAVLSVRLTLLLALRRRRKAFLKLLPDALGLMVRGLRAGMPIGQCATEVGKEVAEPVGGVFRRAGEQVRLGKPLEEALAAETRALDMKPMAFLLVTLSIQRETGGNLAETLDKLDAILRKREQMFLKVRAMSSEARASALIIGSLPVAMGLMMWMVSPEYIMPLFTTAAGRVLLLLAGGSILVGGWLMARMVRFELS